ERAPAAPVIAAEPQNETRRQGHPAAFFVRRPSRGRRANRSSSSWPRAARRRRVFGARRISIQPAAQPGGGIAMALRIELKPHERVIVGECVITNCGHKTAFLVDGRVPILREKDIVTAKTANTPVKRLYLCTQMMYLEDDIPKYQDMYMGFIKDLLEA